MLFPREVILKLFDSLRLSSYIGLQLSVVPLELVVILLQLLLNALLLTLGAYLFLNLVIVFLHLLELLDEFFVFLLEGLLLMFEILDKVLLPICLVLVLFVGGLEILERLCFSLLLIWRNPGMLDLLKL